METFAVSVTYGNRFHLLKQVIDNALSEGVAKVIVVDNNSDSTSKAQLRAYAKMLGNDKLHVLYLDDNYGSAGGFKRGLEFARNVSECDFLWLLDDDNVPQKGSLSALLNTWSNFRHLSANAPVLYAYRGDSRPSDRLAVTQGYIKRYRDNNFAGFHFSTALKHKLVKWRAPSAFIANYPLIKTTFGPYGGMFLHLDTLAAVGLPNEEFFVYADDHEFSLRFESSQIPQFLVFTAKLKDIDFSFTGDTRFFSSISSELKLYYSLRNHTYLSQTFINSELAYSFNKYVYICFLIVRAAKWFVGSPSFTIDRLKLVFRAVADGEKGRLGKGFGK